MATALGAYGEGQAGKVPVVGQRQVELTLADHLATTQGRHLNDGRIGGQSLAGAHLRR